MQRVIQNVKLAFSEYKESTPWFLWDKGRNTLRYDIVQKDDGEVLDFAEYFYVISINCVIGIVVHEATLFPTMSANDWVFVI